MRAGHDARAEIGKGELYRWVGRFRNNFFVRAKGKQPRVLASMNNQLLSQAGVVLCFCFVMKI